MPSASLQQQYQIYLPYLRAVNDRVRDKIDQFCEDNGYPLIGRIKSIESLSDKLEQFRYRKWSEIDDLVGLTIIIPSLKEEEKVIKFLRQEFTERELRKRGSTKKDPASFRFDSTRIYCSIKPLPGLTTDNEPITSIKFEIQIRTAFEHAWIAATHDITYKGKEVDWKAMRLASQIKAAVEQLDLLVVGFSDARKHIAESIWPDIVAQKWILRYIAVLSKTQRISSNQQPKDLVRFSENCLQLFRKSRKSVNKKWDPTKNTRDALKACSVYFRSHKNEIPKSISLLEIFLVALIESGLLKPSNFDSPILHSSELETHIPNAVDFPCKFDFEG